MEPIREYFGKVDLRQKVLLQYINFLMQEHEIVKNILDDKNWASSGSDFHLRCRVDLENKKKELTKQIKILK